MTDIQYLSDGSSIVPDVDVGWIDDTYTARMASFGLPGVRNVASINEVVRIGEFATWVGDHLITNDWMEWPRRTPIQTLGDVGIDPRLLRRWFLLWGAIYRSCISCQISACQAYAGVLQGIANDCGSYAEFAAAANEFFVTGPGAGFRRRYAKDTKDKKVSGFKKEIDLNGDDNISHICSFLVKNQSRRVWATTWDILQHGWESLTGHPHGPQARAERVVDGYATHWAERLEEGEWGEVQNIVGSSFMANFGQ